MSDWGQGYRTDTSYTYSFFRELAPSYLKLICVLQGIAPPQGPLTYLELGSGQGLGPILLAATNPSDSFIGVDFAPEHVLGARRVAEEAGLTNVTFLEDDFESLAAHPDQLPECDVIVLHGVYSWVGREQREAIRAIIRQKLRVGGLVYVSYNCAAGWSQFSPFQKLLRDMALSRGGGFAQTAAMLDRMRQFRDAELGLFSMNATVSNLLDIMQKQSPSYVHHEFMHEHWQPLYSQDVARDMRICKLSFVGSCNPADNVDKLSFPDTVAALVNEEPDPDLRESLRDFHCTRQFRKDLFIRGEIRLQLHEQRAGLASCGFALVKPKEAIEPKIKVPRGELGMNKPGYRAILDALEGGPGSLAGTVPAEELRDLLIVLVHVAAIHPAGEAKDSRESAHRLNRVLTSSRNHLIKFSDLAAPVIGSGLAVDQAFRPALAAVLRGEWREGDADTVLDRVFSDPAYDAFHEGPSDEKHSPSDLKAAFFRKLPVWRHLGLVN